jgi:hypothetical protein
MCRFAQGWTTTDEVPAEKKYFNGIPANQVRTTSPVKHMTDDQWKALVEMWSDAKHKVCQLNNNMFKIIR